MTIGLSRHFDSYLATAAILLGALFDCRSHMAHRRTFFASDYWLFENEGFFSLNTSLHNRQRVPREKAEYGGQGRRCRTNLFVRGNANVCSLRRDGCRLGLDLFKDNQELNDVTMCAGKAPVGALWTKNALFIYLFIHLFITSRTRVIPRTFKGFWKVY